MRREKYVYWTLCSLLLIYIILRAIHVPLVHDEVATFVYYVLPGEFLPGHSHVDANNHHLNSALSTVSDRILGTSPLALRLPNILGFIILITGLFPLASRMRTSLLKWAFILAILGSHYLMEFHGLARGYGLAMAFFICYLERIWTFMERPKAGTLWTAVFLLGLCLSASLTFLFPILILFVLLSYAVIRTRRSAAALSALGVGVVFIGIALKVSFWLKEAGALYYGSEGSFWERTLGSLSTHLTGDVLLAPWLFSAICLLVIYSLIRSLPKIAQVAVIRTRLFHITLVGSVVGIFLSHYLLGTHYPEDRTAVYLFPLLCGAFLLSLHEWSAERPRIRWAALLCFYFPLHFLANMNLSHVDFWFRERIPDSFYSVIASHQEQHGRMATLSGYHTTALTYYMKAHLLDYDVPEMVHHRFPNEQADFIITRINEDSLSFSAYEVAASDPVSGNKLWERRSPMKRERIEQWQETVLDYEGEFFNLGSTSVSGEGDYVVEIAYQYDAGPCPVKNNLVFNMKDSTGVDHTYIPYEANWRYHDKSDTLKCTVMLNGDRKGMNEILVYQWNMEKRPFRSFNYTMTLYRVYD